MSNNHDTLQQAIEQYNTFNFERALETLGRISGDKQYAIPYNELMGHCYYELTQYSNAIYFYEKAVVLNPANSVLESRLAATYDLSKQHAKAFAVFERLYKSSPYNAWHGYQLGYHLLVQQQYEKALERLLEAQLSDEGVHPESYYHIGVCYYNLKEWEDALSYFKAQANVKDGIADCYYLMGNCYRNLYEDEKAIAAFGRAIWYNENHDDAYWQRFLTKNENGDYEEAEKDARRALAINPSRIILTSKEGNPLRIVEVNISRANGNVNFVTAEEKKTAGD